MSGTRPKNITILLRGTSGEDAMHSISISSPIVPRVGDCVYYWVDYPKHKPHAHGCQPGELLRVSGCVVKVEIYYQRVHLANREIDVTTASVFLENYIAVTAPEEGDDYKGADHD